MEDSSNDPKVPQRRVRLPQATKAWRAQAWISFALAVLLCATGLAVLPGTDLDRAFMFMGFGFCLSTVFVLARHVRDQQAGVPTTPGWAAVVWGSFALALVLTAWGLWRMDINPTFKAYLGVAWLFLVSAALTLAKTLRDEHESRQASAA